MVNLSDDQAKALALMMNWYTSGRDKKQFITLGGFAGTGKTTLIGLFRRLLAEKNNSLKVGFASYTGKAARILTQTITDQKILFPQDTIGTIHSLIYSPVLNEKQEIAGWKQKDKLDRNLLIIDEGSMVDSEIWRHLLSYRIPILVVGDHGQLPPIRGSFNLMQKPEIILNTIHRQAETNPIIHLSMELRKTGYIPAGRYSDTVIKFSKNDIDAPEFMQDLLNSIDKDSLVLCGYNTTRQRLNLHIRQQKGFEIPEPFSGDRVICLRNNHKVGIVNGQLGTIQTIEKLDDDMYQTEIELDGEEKSYHGRIAAAQFAQATGLNFSEKRVQTAHLDLFDFGYALTVHKAQGSQAKRVILFEERFKQMSDDEWKSWLYTAITRAEEELYIFEK